MTVAIPNPPTASSFPAAQWRVLAGVMLCYLFFYTGRQNLGFAVKGLQTDLGYTATVISSLNAAMLIGYGIGQSINGNLADIYRARRLIAIGAPLSFLLNWAFSFAASAPLAIALWFANGLAQSTGSPALRRLIVDWFPQAQRGRANGFHLLSAGFSSSLTFALCICVSSFLDWRWIFRLPVITILLGAAAFLILARNRPQDLGHPPLPPEASEQADAGPDERSVDRYRHVLQNRHFLLTCLSIGGESMARYGLLSWVPLHFLAKGSQNLWVTLGLPVGMAVGALTAGYVSDHWFPDRRARVTTWLMAGAAVASLLLYRMPQQSPWAFSLLGCAGFLVYAPQACYWSLGPVLVGRERSGTATGLMDAAAYAFAALGQLCIGRAIDWTGSTFPVFLIIAGACLFGAVVIIPVNK